MSTVKYSVSAYIADGTTTDYLITWDYLDDDHITVEVDGISNADPTASHTFTKLNDTTVRVTDGIGGAIAAGKEIQIRRNTPITTRPISFADGSALLAADLNKNSDYLLYSMQEALDQVDFTVQFQQEAEAFRDETEALRDAAQGLRDLSEADAAEADDHRIAAALSETNAAASEAAAAASEAAAATSEANSAVSEAALQAAQDNAEASATAAAASETAAAASESAAAISEANAAGSEAGVAADAATATSKAAAASVSESNALIYKDNAAASASNSEISAVNSANSATASANSATQAATSEAAAATSRNTAGTYATNSQASAEASEVSRVAAAASETAAASSEANAATSETNAAASEASALTSKEAAEAALDNFDDRYLGAKAADPTTDNDGDPLLTGALYFNTTDEVMKVYDGAVWVAAYASLSGSLLAANNLSDVSDAPAARINLGLTGNSVLPNDAGYITINEVPANNSINEGDTAVTIVDNGTDGKVVVRVDGSDVAEFNDTHLAIPKGTSAERDPNASLGSLRYNTTIGFFETLTGSGWGAVATPPSITGITPSNFSGEAGSTFTVNGAFFDANTTAVFKGADGTEYAAATVTFVNSGQLTITNATNLPVANEPFKVKVTNGAGLSAESIQGIDAGSVPAFTTAAGTIATTTRWDEAVSVTVQASDAESTISGYAVTEGNLPAGLTLDGATGAITGSGTVAQATTTYTFTIGATDSAGNTNTRQFSIQIVNAAPVWVSPAEGSTKSMILDTAGSITLDATDPEGEAVSYTSGALPTGLSLSGNVISGTPTVQANTSVALTASDGFASSVRNFFINVSAPSPFASFGIDFSGENTVTMSPFNNSFFESAADSTAISGAQYWKRLVLTPSITGARNLYFYMKRPDVAKTGAKSSSDYNSDVQIAGIVHKTPSGWTEYYFTDNDTHGFEQISADYVATSGDAQPSSWQAIPNIDNAESGKYGLKYEGGVTGSVATGRLIPPSPVADGASTLSYLYNEGSSGTWGDAPMWGRSPTLQISSGDVIELLVGEDAPAADRFVAYIA